MIELGLERISKLLAKTRLPWRAIHVAGTNGKGSICAYITNCLQTYNTSKYRRNTGASRLKVGRFTSPHLIDRWDCITINQVPVSQNDFQLVEATVLARNAKHNIKASEFELLTATAFNIFTQQNINVGVIEVGMGGRLDATNVLGQIVDRCISGSPDQSTFRPSPLVTAIAKLGLDHQAFLGNTLEKIATEKAGIMKEGVPVVIDTSNPPEVLELLKTKAGDRMLVDFFDTEKILPSYLPQHVQENLRVALLASLSALAQLERLPTPIAMYSGDAAFTSLTRAMLESCIGFKFPGRQESIDISHLINRKSEVLCDGAHNSQSAEVLAKLVAEMRKEVANPVTWVLATSNSKDCRETLRPLLQPRDAVHAVEFGPVDGMPWVQATKSADMVAAARELVPDLSKSQDHGSDLLGALKSASETAHEGPMVIAGSLYLVGDVHRLLRDT